MGSSGELCALNERLIAEMREVVSRSNTMREVRAGLDPEMGERVVLPRTRSPADSLRWYGGGGAGSAGRCASREDLIPQSLSRAANQGNPALTPLEIPGRQKRTYEKVDTLEMSVNSQASLSSPETPGPPSQVTPPLLLCVCVCMRGGCKMFKFQEIVTKYCATLPHLIKCSSVCVIVWSVYFRTFA